MTDLARATKIADDRLQNVRDAMAAIRDADPDHDDKIVLIEELCEAVSRLDEAMVVYDISPTDWASGKTTPETVQLWRWAQGDDA